MATQKTKRITVTKLIKELDKNPMLEEATRDELVRLKELVGVLTADLHLQLTKGA